MQRYQRLTFYVVLWASLIGMQPSGQAATFCVNTAAALHAALTTAASNSEDDLIKIVQGHYKGNFSYVSSETFGLRVKGGYRADCGARTVDPANTVLDGMARGRVLEISGRHIDITVHGLTVQNGSTSEGGGGVWLKGKTVRLTNNTITDNTSHRGGGGVVDGEDDATLINNTITGNTAKDAGGVYVARYSAAITLRNNRITGNAAHRTGGGVYVSGANVTLGNNRITGNTSRYGGGGVVYGRAITLTNNLITGNTTRHRGGGVVMSGDVITLTNNTISQNSAVFDGGGIDVSLFSDSHSADLYNNIIWGNSASVGGDLYIRNDGDGNGVPSPVPLFHNNFRFPAGFASTLPVVIDPSNLTNVDPLFVAPLQGNYHLQPPSPLINQGDNLAPALPPTDQEGKPRIRDCRVDLGALEAPATGNGGCPVARAGGL